MFLFIVVSVKTCSLRSPTTGVRKAGLRLHSLVLRNGTKNKSLRSSQVSDLRRYVQQRGFEILKEYVDVGISGTKVSRPALDGLMSAGRKRLFDVVLVWRFDRFARSTKHLVDALHEFRSLEIDFISYQEAIDTSSPMGEAMYVIIGAMAKLERDIIVERVKAGMLEHTGEALR